MSKCIDCIHYEICLIRYELSDDESEVVSVLECEHFKDRSRFAELPHAEWVEDEDMYGDPIYRCSNCNEHFVLEEGTPTDNCYSYCPNCGAKMDAQALRESENSD